LDGIVAVLVLVICAWGRYGVVTAWHRVVRSVDRSRHPVGALDR
jgi:hypothetical protein